jgi:hypothetical protein
MKKLSLATAAVAALVAAAPAYAAPTFALGATLTGTQADPRGAAGTGVTSIDFTSTGTGNANATFATTPGTINYGGVTYTNSYSLQTASSNNAATPVGATGFYLSVPSTSSTSVNGFATINFSGALQNTSSISLLWGSLDQYNTIAITDASGTTMFTPPAPANGDQGSSRILTINNISSLQSLTFGSAGRAFEVDTLRLTAAVPEPTTWAMMVLGFGAVGFAARRRSKVAGRVVAA